MVEIIDFKSKVKTPVADNSPAEVLLKALLKDKNIIEELICVVRFKNKDMAILHGEVSFDTWCSASKLIDYQIIADIAEDNE